VRTPEAASTTDGRAGPAPGMGWHESVRSTVALYGSVRRDHRGYARCKIRMDPVYRLICERLGRVGSVVDLGTGLALLPALLAVRGQAGAIVGVEWDEAKLASARLACSNLTKVALHAADARSFPLPPADAVCLVDLLHYYPVEEQRALLERAAAALRPGGRLVIRETTGGTGVGVRLTRFLERLSVWLRWNRGPGLVYRERGDIVADLSGLGLECSLENADSILHKGNTLIWAHKRG
jgi:SAM-dependent methyltransferase